MLCVRCRRAIPPGAAMGRARRGRRHPFLSSRQDFSLMASRFGAHLKVWFFFVPLLALVVMPAIPDRALFQITAAETESLSHWLGAERAGEDTRSAKAILR